MARKKTRAVSRRKALSSVLLGGTTGIAALAAGERPAQAGTTLTTPGPGRAATLIVAASNASSKWTTSADYVCTGTNDDLTINAALAALPAWGGTVVLSDGRFTISKPVSPTISNSVLRGQGTNATMIKQQPGSGCNGYQYDQTKQAYNLIFCSIQSLTFLGNYRGGAGDTTGYGCYINYTYRGTGHFTFWDFYLRDVWFLEWPNDGYYSTGGHGYVLDHVLAEYNGGNGVNFAGGFVDSPPRIVDGTYKLNGQAGITVNCVDSYVGHNEISVNSGTYGLILSGSGCKAVGNQIYNNLGTGVHATGGAEGIEVVANTIAYNHNHGLLLDDANCTITGNFFLNNSFSSPGTYDDINIAHGTFSAAGSIIVGNVIDSAASSRYGINYSVSSDTAGVVVANRILNSVTGQVNTAATDTQFIATQPYQTATLVKSVSSNYSIAGNDGIVSMSAAGTTATLPTAVGINGKQYTVKLAASGTATVATTSSQTIDGATTYSLSAQYKYVAVVSDGANWQIVANN